MKVIIVGCGRIGAQLANQLFRLGHQVTVIDQAVAAFDNLDAAFRGRTLEGDVLGQEMLRRAGIESADALAATTSSDTLNAVICHVARSVYHVRNVAARNYEPRWQALYEAFDIQSIGPSSWGAQRLEEMLTDSTLRTVFSAGNGEVEVYEITVPEACRGLRLGNLMDQRSCVAVALTRASKAVLPSPDAILESGDVLHVSATFEGVETLRRQFHQIKEA
ncbi:MAG: NAD-binding protein [Chloroflexi bacterium]|nr:NAD-binding protein [Chloroflexota bacterium]